MDLSSLARFHIAPGYDPADPDGWVFQDRSADVNHKGRGISINGGRGDEISHVEVGLADLEVDNAGGHYCTRNPFGRWYGLLARNCPARWGVISGAEAWTTNTSNGWGTPDVGASWSLDGSASDWSSSGGVGQVLMATANTFRQAQLVGADARNGEATFVTAAPVVATGAALVCSFAARRTAGVSQIVFSVDFGLTGVLGARIKRNISAGLNDIGGTPTVGSYTPGQRIKARCQWDGQDLRLRVWPEASAEPATWHCTATDVQCLGSAVAVHSWRVTGNTNVGSLTFAYDDLEIEAVEIVGTIPAFPVRWDPTAQVSWAPIQIAGINRRLSQGQQALRSPMYRQISGYTNLIGYWPMEDGTGATQLANVVSGGAPGTTVGMQFGGAGPAGSAGAATFTEVTDASKVSGSFKSASTTAGWQISWSTMLAALPVAGLRQMIHWQTSGGYDWAIYLDTGVYNIRVFSPTDVLLIDSSVSFTGTGEPNQWVTFRMKATQSGGNVLYEFAWFVQAQETPYGTSGSFAGSVGALRYWTANGNADMQNGLMAHVFGVTTGTDDLQSYNALRAFDGYVGELAADRVARLCGEEGVPVAVEAGDSEPMGVQPMGVLMDLLRQCEDSDLGVLYESGAALGYRPRGARYNRAVDLALQIAADGDIADPAPEPTDDDQRIRNDWTVSRLNGSDGSFRDDAHIAASGRYPDTATINIAGDGRLVDHAAWRVHLGTWGEMRWPQVTLNLNGRADLLTSWLGRPFGPRITISGVPSQGPVGSDVDLIVEGWRQEITSDGWVVTLNCSPAQPWDVAVFDLSLAGAVNCTTNSTLTASTGAGVALSLLYDNPKDAWSTTPGYQLILNDAEVVTVTAMAAPSGTSPTITQAATITRAVNGIAVAHAVGEPVQLYPAPRFAL